jgi:methylmalonyl-CoA mutase
MTKAIESGMAKLRIEESATRKQARIDSTEDVVVGVNKYKVTPTGGKKDGHEVQVLSIDNSAVRESQIAKLHALKSKRDVQQVENALSALTAAAEDFIATQRLNSQPTKDIPRNPANNLLKLSVDAARARATLGAINF